MSPILLKSLTRDVWAMRLRLAALALMAALAVGIYVGVYSAVDSLFASRDYYLEAGNAADLELRFVPEDRQNLPSFDDIPGVKAVESRLLSLGYLERGDKGRLPALVVADDAGAPRSINRLTLSEGEDLDPAHPNQIVIDRHFADYHDVKVGDHLQLTMGNAHYDLRVRGIALSPEHLLASANPNFFLPSKGSQAVLFVPLQLFERQMSFYLVNSLEFDLKTPSAELTELIRKRAEKRLTVEEAIPLKQQFSYLFMEVDLRAFSIFLPAVVVIFSLATVVTTWFLVARWITSQRQQIGVLKALGYSSARLLTAYLYPLILVAIVAAVLGSGFATLVLFDFGSSYTQAVGFPEPILHLTPQVALQGGIGLLLGLGLAGLWPLLRLQSITPQEAVRNSRDNNGDGGIGPISAPLMRLVAGRLWLRYPLRNLLRDKLVTATTVLSGALALGVSLSYFIASTSFHDTIKDNFQREPWNLVVDFITPVWDDELTPFQTVSGVDAVAPFLRGPVRLVTGKKMESSLVTGLAPENNLRHVQLLAGRYLEPGDKDVLVLEHKVARQLGVTVDDSVSVDVRGTIYAARVIGIFSGALPGESLAPLGTLRQWLNMEGQNSGLLVHAQDPVAVAKALSGLKRVGRVTSKQVLADEALKISQEALVIIYIAAAFSIIVTLLALFSSAAFSVLARRYEYVMLRILGFSDRIIGLIISVEVVACGIFAGLLAVPLGYALAVFLVSRLSDAWFMVEATLDVTDVATIMVPALLVLPLAAWPPIRTVLSVSIIKTLRERMFG